MMNGLPANVSELDLLDFVEEQLPSQRRAEVAAALVQDPVLARLVAGMIADRGDLRALGNVGAPAMLLERVEAALEREALLGLASGEPTSDRLPVSAVVPARPNVWRVFWENTLARRLAVAAGLTLTASAGIWVFYSVAGPAAPLGPSVAGRSGTGNGDEGGVSEPGGGDIASMPAENESPEGEMALAERDGSVGVEGAATEPMGAEPVAIADAGDAGPADAASPITAAQAVELAQEGRLAIRVRAADPEAAAARIDLIAAAQAGREARWRSLDPSARPAVALAVAAGATPGRSNGNVSARQEAPPAHASENSQSPPVPSVTRPQDQSPAAVARTIKPLYTVELDARERDLTALLSLLTRERAQRAEFVALPAPIETPPSLEPGAILWWGRGPANWVKRASVPIVVEPAR